ncbi:hypothetical protein SZ64_03410 [Erythrobacter sp. SG61-1L]|uniref:hypothetical protein n=1 Tax=Erythrobacter sp. SG61-1L TaxID=1603897 RepID=UPI0006C9366D|nr:hypothetical protein [Erythrobacter sp. SG61-1L]KPL67226.1 hypothetical protein SZ64_03410 [Erythrobacter sp. SG61-1L]
MFDRIVGAALVTSALLAFPAQVSAQGLSTQGDSADYAKALTCEAFYVLLSQDAEGQDDGNAEIDAYLAQTWHDYIASTYPDGFNERHDAEFDKVADDLASTLNAMDDSSFNDALEQILTTCEKSESDPAFPG